MKIVKATILIKHILTILKNLKVESDLSKKLLKKVEGLPQYVWEPVRFSENDDK